MNTWSKVGCCLVAVFASLYASVFAGGFPCGDYWQLEYVRLTGSQVFQTRVTPTADPGYQIDVSYCVDEYVYDGHVFGTDAGNSWLYASWGAGSQRYIWGCNGVNKTGGTWEQKFHTLVFNRTNDYAVVLDGTALETGSPHASTSQIKIGQRQGGGAILRGRIYNFSVIDHATGAKVIDYVPAKERAGSQRVGFYDLVNDEFVPAKSGTPEAGPVIPLPGEPAVRSITVGNIQMDSALVTVEMTAGAGHETATIELSVLKDGDTEPVVHTLADRSSGVHNLELSGLDGGCLYRLAVTVNNGENWNPGIPVAFKTRSFSGDFPYEDYHKLEYVRFTGSQVFLTGVVPLSVPGCQIDVAYCADEYVYDGHVFGTDAGNSWLYASWGAGSQCYIWGCNGVNKMGGTWEQKFHTLVFNRTNDYAVVLDGTALETGIPHASTSQIKIGQRQDGGAIFRGRIYNFSVINHATCAKVIDYVPAKERAGSQRAGFYDLVNDEFVPAKSGTPEAGPVVPRPGEAEVKSVAVGDIQMNSAVATVEITTGEGHEKATIELSVLKEGDAAPVVYKYPDESSGTYSFVISGLAKGSKYELTVFVDNGDSRVPGAPLTFKTRAFSGSFPYRDYDKLEYVRFTGSQVFLTGVVPLSVPGYQINVSYYTENFVNDGHVFGTNVGSSWLYTSWGAGQGDPSYYIWGCNGVNKKGGTWEQKFHALVFNRTNDYAVVLDGTVLETGIPHASTSQIKIGQREDGGAILQGRIYSFSVIDHATGAKVLDYVPARERKGAKRVGFYDLAEEEFVPAKGGTPEAGPVRGGQGLVLFVK